MKMPTLVVGAAVGACLGSSGKHLVWFTIQQSHIHPGNQYRDMAQNRQVAQDSAICTVTDTAICMYHLPTTKYNPTEVQINPANCNAEMALDKLHAFVKEQKTTIQQL